MKLHPTLTAWNRDEEEGGYKAEIDGWTLHVKWERGDAGGRRGFSWTAKGPEEKSLSGTGVREEIEHAMALAEHAVAASRGAPEPDSSAGEGAGAS